MPNRIQRKRTKGWRMPEGAVYVGRPTIFGNPFTVAEYGDGALRLHRLWLTDETMPLSPELAERRAEVLRRLPELKGKDLACFCREGSPCHADVLIELANRGKSKRSFFSKWESIIKDMPL
jgi:hypothetical protein